MPQQLHGSVPRSVLTSSITQLTDKAVLTSKAEHGGKNPVPSLHGSQQDASSLGAVLLVPGPAERF